MLGADHPEVAQSLNNLASLLQAQGDLHAARPLWGRLLVITETHARSQLAALSAQQRLAFLRSTRYRLDNWVRFATDAHV